MEIGNVPYGNSLYYCFENPSAELEARRRAELAALDSRAAALAHVAKVRRRLAGVLGSLEFPPGNSAPAVTGQLRKNDVLIDRVVLESRPGIFSCGLFFRAENHSGNLPGVLGVCGHSFNGKAEESYQAFAFGLARKGFGVFLVDPPGQGESHQFRPGLAATLEHNAMGKALLAAGVQPAALFIHDAQRALDYLLSRPEIRPGHAGVTGSSGGGQMSYYLFGLDDRIEIAACSCHMNTFRYLYRDEIATDAESSPYGLLAAGGDRPDFAIAGAPKPLLLLGTEGDFVDRRGLEQAHRDIAAVYRLLGVEAKLQLYIGPGPHHYHRAQREQMYAFFTEYYFGKADPREPEFEPLSEAECQVTPNGSVLDLPGARTERAFALSLVPSRRKLPDAERIGQLLRRELKLDDALPPVPDYRSPRPLPLAPGTVLSRFVIDSEPGTPAAPVLHLGGTGTFPLIPRGRKGVLYVAHLDSRREYPQACAGEAECPVFALDVRGVGESRSTAGEVNGSDFFAPVGCEYFMETTARMHDLPLLGGKVRDVLAAVSLLRAHGYDELRIVGFGLGGLVVAVVLAAVRCPVGKVTLRGVPASLEALIAKGSFRCPQSHLVFGMLREFDWSELYRVVAGHCDLELETAEDVPPEYP